MEDRPTVEPLGGHAYLVSGQQDGTAVEVRVVVDPAFLATLEVDGGEEARAVEATVGYLLGHQRLDELPPQLYLEDVAAAYADFAEHLQGRLSSSGGAGGPSR